ncbi:MAG: glycosyltransferase family 2 protein, partial [Bacteroidia bacterium]
AGNILHYSYYTIEEHYRQADKFSTIAAKALYATGKRSSLLLAAIKTGAKFLRNYIIKLGFLDGHYGFVICRISAGETWQKYTKLRKLHSQ